MKKYVHGVWYDTKDIVEPVPVQSEQIYFTGEPETPYERFQKEKYRNFIKEQGTADDYDEFKQGFVYNQKEVI